MSGKVDTYILQERDFKEALDYIKQVEKELNIKLNNTKNRLRRSIKRLQDE